MLVLYLSILCYGTVLGCIYYFWWDPLLVAKLSNYSKEDVKQSNGLTDNKRVRG